MLNFFYFSSYVRPAIVRIKFAGIVLVRFLKIFFRFNKQLKIIDFDYAKKYQFEQGLLVIRYQFKNALWYHFKGIKQTTKEGVIILNLSNIPKIPVILIVYGFFRKRIFQIEVNPEARMQTKPFQIKINKLQGLSCYTLPITLCTRHNSYPAIPKMVVKYSAIQMRHDSICLKYPSFNQTNFL